MRKRSVKKSAIQRWSRFTRALKLEAESFPLEKISLTALCKKYGIDKVTRETAIKMIELPDNFKETDIVELINYHYGKEKSKRQGNQQPTLDFGSETAEKESVNVKAEAEYTDENGNTETVKTEVDLNASEIGELTQEQQNEVCKSLTKVIRSCADAMAAVLGFEVKVELKFERKIVI